MHFKPFILCVNTLVARQAVAKIVPHKPADDFSGLVNGEGNVDFGNQGVACTVDGEQGERTQFGSSFKLNVNEIDILADDVRDRERS
ncbi:hypothetical protein Daus18300_004405 [Diaporthe australafricana]|uniref:Uncharacterized protein n=1 Tax=Diaporthe australafricana TaxID=127596 RepID=A0ABR3X9Z5_9PEZI